MSTLSLAGLLAACGTETEPETQVPAPTPGRQARSALARNTAPAVPAGNLDALVTGNTAFATRLHAELRSEPGNLFYSPHSISVALGMTYAGARGGTETEMAQALSFQLPQPDLHPAFNQLDLALSSRGQGASGADGQPFRLRVRNALFAQEGFELLPDFLDALAVNYGAGVSLLDFIEATEEARRTINEWVEDVTEGRIPELIPPGILTANTVLVLTNAVYFNASWASPFEPSSTADGAFTTPSGPATVPMMKKVEELGYAETANYQAVALPYDGDELDMVVVVPTAGTFDSFEASFDAAQLESIVGSLSPVTVDLSLPRFETRFKASLVESLSALGMPSAFSGEADLSGMNGRRDLFIQDVIHEAFVKVDESGTEAAAATAVIVGRTSAPIQQAVLTVDRPFLFLIRDRQTGAVVFMGRIVDPR